MKLNKIMLAASLALGVVSFSSLAKDEGHGQVTFTGSIIDAPCSIAPDSLDQSVNLGQVANALLDAGKTSTPQTFNIQLENCTLSTAKTVTTTFTGKEVNGGFLGITGTAKGAGIALIDMGNGGKLIELGKPTAAQQVLDGKNTLSFAAYLTRVEADDVDGQPGKPDSVVPGDFTGVTNFTLAYQ